MGRVDTPRYGDNPHQGLHIPSPFLHKIVKKGNKFYAVLENKKGSLRSGAKVGAGAGVDTTRGFVGSMLAARIKFKKYSIRHACG